MELTYAFLANTAGHLQDGRLCIFGAGIEGLEVKSLPYAGPPLALVAKLVLRPDEPREGHRFRVELTTPNGDRSSIGDDLDLDAYRSHVNPEGPAGLSIVANLMVRFQDPGEYHFHLVIDGAETMALPFFVKSATSNGPTGGVNPKFATVMYGSGATSAVEADLEDAADVEELKRLVPSNARLLALAAERSPPLEWFEHDEESPF